jgi:phosphate transport system permease protein
MTAADVPPIELRPAGSAQRRGESRFGWGVAGVLGVAAALIAPAVLAYLLLGGVAFLTSAKWTGLLSTRWLPGEGAFGLVPLIVGSLSVAMLGLVLAIPLGLGTAIVLRFYARGRVQRTGEAVLGVAGGVPSVVFGLFGTLWFVPHLGASLLSAALVLAAMLAPTLATLDLAALRQLPSGLLLDGGRLGLTREQVILRLALRAARPALLGASVLALSRALGEALAVEMVCGNVPGLPTSLTDPVRTLTSTLVQEFEYARAQHGQALHLVALAVVLIAALSSAAALKLAARRSP